MKTDYTRFDEQLLSLIQSGVDKMSMLETRSVLRDLAKPHQDGGRTPAFRVIDRRLQALRKAGKIRFNGKGWESVIPK